tara:strand:+ start:261 stop:464 length:204 start_codon:yes stop_codon:yes gene_type:complete
VAWGTLEEACEEAQTGRRDVPRQFPDMLNDVFGRADGLRVLGVGQHCDVFSWGAEKGPSTSDGIHKK